MGVSRIATIPVGSIRENTSMLRAVDRKSAGYLQLLSSIKQMGVLSAISVREMVDPDTKQTYFSLVDGLHRLTAARDANLPTINASIIEATDIETLQAQMIANINVIATKPVEYTKQLQRLLATNPMMTQRELADMVNVEPSFINNRLGLLKLSEQAAKLVDEQQIPLTNAYALAKLPMDEQSNFIDRAMTMDVGTFAPLVTSRISSIREANRSGKDKTVEVFVPVASLRKRTEIVEELDRRAIGAELVALAKVEDTVDAFYLGIQYVLNLDPKSIEAQRNKFEAEKSAKAEAAKKRAEAAAAKAATVPA